MSGGSPKCERGVRGVPLCCFCSALSSLSPRRIAGPADPVAPPLNSPWAVSAALLRVQARWCPQCGLDPVDPVPGHSCCDSSSSGGVRALGRLKVCLAGPGGSFTDASAGLGGGPIPDPHQASASIVLHAGLCPGFPNKAVCGSLTLLQPCCVGPCIHLGPALHLSSSSGAEGLGSACLLPGLPLAQDLAPRHSPREGSV